MSDSRSDQGAANVLQHFLLRTLDDADKGEHVLGVGQPPLGGIAHNDRGAQIGTALLDDQPIALSVLGAQVLNTGLLEALFDPCISGLSLPRHGKGRQCGLGVFRRLGGDGTQMLGQGLGNLPAVS